MSYGFQQFDASGNLVLDSSAPVKTFVVYEQAKSIYVNAPYSGSTSYTDVTVPGVTSQQDLDDNYVFIRRDGGAFSIWGCRDNSWVCLSVHKHSTFYMAWYL